MGHYTNSFMEDSFIIDVYIKQLIAILLLQANTLQAAIVAGQQMTFVFFIYGDILWGGGTNAGFNAGDGTSSFMVPGALTN